MRFIFFNARNNKASEILNYLKDDLQNFLQLFT